ncbi:hypothetical protein A7X76_13890 [Stenotrophomonas maltophilia]|uniref:hypothetical protein n=1 Tax=Stenotrophomonas maltophilia TaxID=40324 RepID=UPI000DAACCF0|nr:hypothetical protein [Stenotrophomonas maltophilia]PZS68258.1 hypothetical protein A7X76_13890 [Stenotrophomonas maltophilia]
MNALLRDELAHLLREHTDPDATLREAARGALRALEWACALRPDFAPHRDALRAALHEVTP